MTEIYTKSKRGHFFFNTLYNKVVHLLCFSNFSYDKYGIYIIYLVVQLLFISILKTLLLFQIKILLHILCSYFRSQLLVYFWCTQYFCMHSSQPLHCKTCYLSLFVAGGIIGKNFNFICMQRFRSKLFIQYAFLLIPYR